MVKTKPTQHKHLLHLNGITARSVDELIDQISDIYHDHRRWDQHYILIDMRQANLLLVRLMAMQMQTLLRFQEERDSVYFALVLSDTKTVDITATMLKTIFQRDTVQYFTQPVKAQLWLNMMMNHNKH